MNLTIVYVNCTEITICFKAKSVKVKTLTHSLMECDGEIKGETPAEFRVLSGAIDFMIGE